MALLGHVSAAMSLRYGRLFDATVRNEYQRALTLAKAQLGPVLPGERTQLPLAAITGGNWRDAPLIKARLAGGYCLRTVAQGSCAYANICEHCPNFRCDAGFLARPAAPNGPTPTRSRPTPRPAAGARKQPATAASSNGSTCSSPEPMRADHDRLARVEQACIDLAAAGRRDHLRRGRRPRRDRPDHPLPAGRPPRHRHRAPPPRTRRPTLTGLAVQLDQLAPQPRSRRRQSPPPRRVLRRLERSRRKCG